MQFDRYEVMCREDGSMFRLGHGANSSSYKALDLDLQTPVVLKVIRQDLVEDDTARRRFLREARAAAALRHPNVAQIYRLGEVDGTCFYAREYVEGETLETRVQRDGPLPPVEAMEVALQVAEALVAVKKMNMVHREIKPSNLMVTAGNMVKIIDFGLAKGNPQAGGEALGAITLSGFVGTPDYASPEQLNEQELDVLSDIYSLGVTLWFLLTGRPTFRGAMAQVMARHLQSPPPFEELSAFPPAVVSLLAHLLEKDPARRPATPQILVTEIEACLRVLRGETPALAPVPMEVMKPPVAVELKKMSAARVPVERAPAPRFMFAEVLVGAGIAALIYFILSRPLPPPPSSAPGVPATTVAASPATGSRIP